MKKWLFIPFLTGYLLLLYAPEVLSQQQDTVQTRVQEQLEQAFEEFDEEDGRSGEDLIQFLEDLAANPVSLNTAGFDELLQIPGMNLKIAADIIEYRKTKPFEQKDELLKVSGIGRVTYNRISPYVTVDTGLSGLKEMYGRPEYWLSGRRTEFISRFQQELQQQEGYKRPAENGGYLGSPVKYYQRLKLSSRHLSINMTQEKDPGEPLKNPAEFDFTSGHIALLQNGKLKSLVIGDYSLGFGQGLALWTGASFGKGREVIRTAGKNERGVRPYSSAQETDFYRGAAATYGEKLELTAFYSNRKRTASVAGADSTRFPSSSGFHRTQNELDRRNNLGQLTYGGHLRWNTPAGFFGATAYRNEFSSYIVKAPSLSNKYDFEGKSNSVVSVDYRGLLGSVLLFGEAARSENGGTGVVAGLESPVGDRSSLVLHYRNYSRHFQSFMGTGFGESSSHPRNEEGFYVGFRHSPGRIVTLSAYADQFLFPAPRSGLTQSAGGLDVLGLVEADFSRAFSLYLLLRSKTKGEEYRQLNDRGLEETVLGRNKRSSARLEGAYQVSREVRLRSRVEFVRARKAGKTSENGFLIYQDIRFYPVPKLQIDARFTLFDTQSFDTRVYQFENDLLYVMSNTMLSGQGQRSYITVKYEAFKMLDIWLKYGVTFYEDVHTISSGLSEIQGRKKNSLGLQARLRF